MTKPMHCEYCERPQRPVPIFFKGVDAPVIAVRKNQLEVMYYKHRFFFKDDHFIEHKPINFCPICGRKLDDDNENNRT